MRVVPGFVKQSLKKLLEERGWQSPETEAATRVFWSMQSGLQRLRSIGIQPKTVVDLGAAEGKWTLMASQIFPDARFLLCEPLPDRKSQLTDLVASSGGRFHLSSVIVGNSNEPILFDVSSDLDGSGVYGGDSGQAMMLPQDTLDSLLLNDELASPFLIKFDTHGFESEILAGAKEALQSTVAIVMECYVHQISPTCKPFWEMCRELDALGFRPIYFSDFMARPFDETLWQLDIFFVRSSHPVFQHKTYQ